MDAKDFACRSKVEAKPQRRERAGSSPRTVPIEKRTWIDVEPGKYSLFDYEISVKLIHLFNSGELKKIFRNISCIALIGLIASGRKAWQEEEETRNDTSTVLILQEQLCISELFKDIHEVIPRDRSWQPVGIPQRGARPQQFIIGNDETELELSVNPDHS